VFNRLRCRLRLLSVLSKISTTPCPEYRLLYSKARKRSPTLLVDGENNKDAWRDEDDLILLPSAGAVRGDALISVCSSLSIYSPLALCSLKTHLPGAIA
jgi:hypothetical protein